MARKENKGGNLTNEQIEQDNKVKGKHTGQGQYEGAQDTGDHTISSLGTEVQRKDGLPDEELNDD
jgi:hypothetical protein